MLKGDTILMNTQTPIYLLAGGRGHKIATTLLNVRMIIKSIGKVKPNVAFIGVASLKDNWLVYAIISAFIKAGSNCRIQRVVIARPNADLDKACEIIQKADAVFFSGGDAEAGMQILKEKKLVEFFQKLSGQGKLLIGVSAGTIMLSKEWVRWKDSNDDSTAELFPCLGLVPIICDTHAEEDNWVELKAALQLEKDGVIGYGIPSGAYLKAYPDGRLEAEVDAVARYTMINEKFERQSDILPVDQAVLSRHHF
jgi:peptidase E